MRLKSLKGLVLAASLMFLSLPVLAERISMESASANSVVGLLPQAMAPSWSKAGLDIELALGQTLTKSLLKIGSGSLDSAVVPPLAFSALSKGQGPYKKLGAEKGAKLAANTRVLFGFASSTYHPIVWADSGIETWKDIKGKKIYIGAPAGAASRLITTLIKTASGFEEGKDYDGIKAPWNVAMQGFRDGQYDVAFIPSAIGSQSITELSLSRNIRLLSLNASMTPPAGLGMGKIVIPENTYAGQVNKEKAVNAWLTVMMIAVKKDMSDDVAYGLTKTYFDSLDEARKGNDLLKTVSAEQRFEEVVGVLHPGAVKYYKEQNIEIPAALIAE